MAKRYRPSNGTEGCWFSDKFCEHCIHEKFMHTQKPGDQQCDIFNRAFMHDITDKEYPDEWTYDENDHATCTAFKKWDWGYDDETGGPTNIPPEPIPEDPNQLCFPFIFDELQIPKINNNEQQKLSTEKVC